MNVINNTLQNKLQALVSFLSQVNRGFDGIAEEIDCKNLKTALLALAVESRQYANEIRDHLQELQIIIQSEYNEEFWEKIESEIHEQAGIAKGGEIRALCNNCEDWFGKMYRDVLQEAQPLKGLKEIITCQLLAAQFAFTKIRLLNDKRFNNYKTGFIR